MFETCCFHFSINRKIATVERREKTGDLPATRKNAEKYRATAGVSFAIALPGVIK